VFGATHYRIKRRTTNGGPYIEVATTSLTSYVAAEGGMQQYYVVSAVRGTAEGRDSNQANALSLSGANVARGKTVAVSSTYPGSDRNRAVDANMNTRWISNRTHSEWIHVYLGSVVPVDRVVLRWEFAYGKAYTVSVSNDALTWNHVYATTSGDGRYDDITFPATAPRYVRMQGSVAATIYGFSTLNAVAVSAGGSDECPGDRRQ
jgi:hypothetical protein